jgi:uncharacterized protein with PIN domain
MRHEHSTLALAALCPAPRGSGLPPRFYCDEMLGHLARFLRAAGFDTRLACDGASDSQILREAADEERWLLTLDRRIMEHKAEGRAAHYARVPVASRPLAQAVKHCPECGRIYWRGSHFERMRRRLLSWQERRST